MPTLFSQKDPFSQITFGFTLHLLAKIALEITQNQIIYALIGLIGWYYIIHGFIKFKFVWRVPFKKNIVLYSIYISSFVL